MIVLVSFSELDNWLRRTPVIADVHPLIPLCLRPDTIIVLDTETFISELDSCGLHDESPRLIIRPNRVLSERFPHLRASDHPPVDELNTHMGSHLEYARTSLLTTHKLASHIQEDVRRHPADTIVVFLVDGLSYGDVLAWPGEIQPCFVDGPSVTYRFYKDDKRRLVEKVGFASIVNRPSIYQRLYELGYHHARGYTYWNPEDNIIADYMFAGIPYEKVTNFDSLLRLLDLETFVPQTYIQLVRQGLDGLAHNRRELHSGEIEMATQTILDDVGRLFSLFERKGTKARIYLTADHGILWKRDLRTNFLLSVKDSHARFSEQRPDGAPVDSWVRTENDFIPYYLFRHPYLGHSIPADDSGVHGGLSYQESIVPFIKFEV